MPNTGPTGEGPFNTNRRTLPPQGQGEHSPQEVKALEGAEAGTEPSSHNPIGAQDDGQHRANHLHALRNGIETHTHFWSILCNRGNIETQRSLAVIHAPPRTMDTRYSASRPKTALVAMKVTPAREACNEGASAVFEGFRRRSTAWGRHSDITCTCHMH